VAFRVQADLFKLRNQEAELLALLKRKALEQPEQLAALGALLDGYGFPEEAESAYRKFADADLKQPVRQLMLADFVAGRDRPAEAMELITRFKSAVPIEQVAAAALTVYNAPSVTAEQKQLIETWILEAIQKRPDLLALSSKLALIRIDQGRVDEAETLFRRVLASAPDDVEALNNLAWLLALREPSEPEAGLPLIDRAIDLTGAVPGLLDTRAVVRIRLGQPQQALQDLADARAVVAGTPTLALHQAWAHHAAGDAAAARTDLAEARELKLRVDKIDSLERPHFDRLIRALEGNAP
jgi:tetratricopeptide (TPR) repeat protein